MPVYNIMVNNQPPAVTTTCINPTYKTKLLEWMLQVCEHYKLEDGVYDLAKWYVDRLCAIATIKTDRIQLVGITCVWIANKVVGQNEFNAKDCSAMTRNTYTWQEVIACEQQVCVELKWKLSAPLACDFVSQLGTFVGLHKKKWPAVLKKIRQNNAVVSENAKCAASIIVCMQNKSYWIRRFSKYVPRHHILAAL